MKTFGWILGVGLALVVVGCGGSDDGGGSCGDTSACGGDIVGNWKISSSCVTLETSGMTESMDCPGLTSEGQDVAMSGTVAYNADKTYQANVTVTGSVVLNIPASCLTQGGFTASCSQLQQSLQASAGDGGFQSVSCSGSSSCSCTLTLVPEVLATNGTYSTSGGTLTQTETNGTPDNSTYCVKGSTLTLSPQGATSGISGSVVFSKQ